MKIVRETVALALLFSCFKAPAASVVTLVPVVDDQETRCTGALDAFFEQLHASQPTDNQNMATALADILSCMDLSNQAAALAIATKYTPLSSMRNVLPSDASTVLDVIVSQDSMVVIQSTDGVPTIFVAPATSLEQATVHDQTTDGVLATSAAVQVSTSPDTLDSKNEENTLQGIN